MRIVGSARNQECGYGWEDYDGSNNSWSLLVSDTKMAARSAVMTYDDTEGPHECTMRTEGRVDYCFGFRGSSPDPDLRFQIHPNFHGPDGGSVWVWVRPNTFPSPSRLAYAQCDRPVVWIIVRGLVFEW